MDSKMRIFQAPERRLVMTLALRQAVEILQMPQLELAQWIRAEVEKNPLLEEVSRLAPSSLRFQGEVEAPKSLYEHLSRQIKESFEGGEERRIAEYLLHGLDEKGFVAVDLGVGAAELQVELGAMERVLSVLQTFDPPGIFARNLQESLLLQLLGIGEGSSVSYCLVRDCFHDLLNGRFKSIEKKLGEIDLTAAVQKLSRLSFRPSGAFCSDVAPTVLPDLHIMKVERKWKVEVAEEELPKIQICPEYENVQPGSSEEKDSLRGWTLAAKWLFRSLHRRRQLLLQVGIFLIRKQALFLEQKGKLRPLTMEEMAQELQLHESTLSRTINGKFAATPRGVVSLRSLIQSSPETEAAKEGVRMLIGEEDKERPWTDEELMLEMKKRGFSLARRTVAKYRQQLHLGTASARKHFR